MVFHFRSINVVRRYAKADRIFGNIDMNCHGKVEQSSKHIIKENVFELPEVQSVASSIIEKLKESFLIALDSVYTR